MMANKNCIQGIELRNNNIVYIPPTNNFKDFPQSSPPHIPSLTPLHQCEFLRCHTAKSEF